jgi:hypothetical protein
LKNAFSNMYFQWKQEPIEVYGPYVLWGKFDWSSFEGRLSHSKIQMHPRLSYVCIWSLRALYNALHVPQFYLGTPYDKQDKPYQ